MVFMVWNALNDPFFAWLSQRLDNPRERHIAAVRYGGLALSASAVLPWFPWTSLTDSDGGGGMSPRLAAVHLCVSLCVWDAAYSLVIPEVNALVTEVNARRMQERMRDAPAKAINPKDSHAKAGGGRPLDIRVIVNAVGFTSGAVVSGFVSHAVRTRYDAGNMAPFRAAAMCIAALSALGWELVARALTPFARAISLEDLAKAKAASKGSAGSGNAAKGFGSSDIDMDPPLGLFLRQLLTYRNFQTAAWAYFFWQFAMETVTSMFLVVGEAALPDAGPLTKLPVLNQQIGYMVPPLLLASRMHASPSAVWRGVAAIALGLAALGLGMGQASAYTPLLFVAVKNASEAARQSANDVLGDVTMEDVAKYRRRRSQATMYNGIQAVILKPAQSLGPMLAVRIMSATNHDGTSALRMWHGLALLSAVAQLGLLAFNDVATWQARAAAAERDEAAADRSDATPRRSARISRRRGDKEE